MSNSQRLLSEAQLQIRSIADATGQVSLPSVLLHDVMDCMEQGVVVWNEDGICELCNERVYEVLELSEDRLYIGMSRVEFLQMGVERGEFAQQVVDDATLRFLQGEPFSFDRAMPSGRKIITTARPRDGGGFVVTFSDITALKDKEAELNDARDRAEKAETELARQLQNVTNEKVLLVQQQNLLSQLSMVATHAKDIIVITDASGCIEWVNGSFSKLIGLKLDEISGQSFVESIRGEETSSVSEEEITEGIEGRHVVRTELLCHANGGNTFWMELEITPVFSDDGRHTNFVAVGRDTTIRKTADKIADDSRDFERRKRNEANLLAEFNGWLQSTDSLSELFPVVSAFLSQLLPESSGAVYVYANSRDVLEGVCSWNNGQILANFEPPDCWALRRGRNYFYGENKVDFLCNHIVESHTESLPARHYCLPIIAHGDTVGLLSIELPYSDDTNASLETQKLTSFCSEQISLAIANVRLREQLLDQSTRDPLTSLYNRRYFIECIRRELCSDNDKRIASLISIDVDHFKKFNDNFGHDAGDTVLREMSQVLINSFRGSDTPCRYGGEEFAIFMPGASANIATQRAEELRMAVENNAVLYNGEDLRTTISCGVATFPDNGTTVQALIKNADRALYAAKDNGRNNVQHIDSISQK